MTFLANPQHFTRAEIRVLIHSIKMGAWAPSFLTVHNTGVPSLRQYLAYGPTPQAQFAANQAAYERGLGWHSGVHFFCCPAYIWYVCDLAADGVSVSCWNRETIAFEMVGDFEVGADDFLTGPGADVRANAIWLAACIHEKFGWDPETIRFHRECAADHHACPGSKVDKPAFIAAVKAQLQLLKADPLPVAAEPVAPVLEPVLATRIAAPAIWSVEDIQGALNRLGDHLEIDGDYGPATKAAVTSFQRAHGLDIDGWVGPDTTKALVAALNAP